MIRTTTSASNFFRRVSCPGSAWAECGQVQEPDSPDASLGVRLHAMDAADEDGTTISEVEFLKRNRNLRNEFMEIQRNKYKIGDGDPCITIKDNLEFWLNDESGLPLMFNGQRDGSGHPDFVEYHGQHKILFVADTKTGRKPVPSAEINFQLRAYAVQLATEFEVDTCVVFITQPLCRPTITSCTYDRDDLAKSKAELLEIWRNTLPKDAPRYPSYAACEHCSALASCHEGISLMKELAATKISEIPIDQLEALAPKVELVEAVCAAFWKRLKWIAHNQPSLLQNLELKPGATVESVEPADTDNAGALLQVHGALSKEQFGECRKLTMSKVRQIVGENLGLSEDDAKAKVAQILKPVLRVKQNAPSLVERKRVVMLENK